MATNNAFEPISIHKDVAQDLRKVSYDMTGRAGKRVTLSEALRRLIENYEQNDFAFLNEPSCQ
jgi:hypothetical protein